MTARRRWLTVGWLAIGLALWCGVFDLLITRGAKQYLLEAAQHDAGEGPAPGMVRIMMRTRHDAWQTATWFALPVVVAGVGTVWLVDPDRAERRRTDPMAARFETRGPRA